ncbi:MAG TPA: hypothetical protein VIS77_15145 [Burkholderiales bacterium]
MDDGPRAGLDPVAIAIHAVLAVVALAGGAYVVLGVLEARRSAPPAPAPVARPSPAPRAIAPNAPPTKKPPPAQAAAAAVAMPAPPARSAPRTGPVLAEGARFVYVVSLEPPAWRNAELAYRAHRQPDGRTGVEMVFEHGVGARSRMTWNLGVVQPGDPGHANLRYPGFFMHAAHFPRALEAGRRFSWTYPWQAADGALRPGRERRFDAVVAGPEVVAVPAGRFEATRIDVTLSYVEGGRAEAMVRETLWYAQAAGQLVKVLREGRSPDEGAQRILSELKSFSRP